MQFTSLRVEVVKVRTGLFTSVHEATIYATRHNTEYTVQARGKDAGQATDRAVAVLEIATGL